MKRAGINCLLFCGVALAALASAMLAGCGPKPNSKLATPKSAARTLFQAMYDDDLATAKSCVVDGPGQQTLVQGMTRMCAAMRRATDAAVKRYGPEIEKLLGPSPDVAHVDTKQIDAAAETIDGDTAMLAMNSKLTYRLIRTNGEWKLDLTTGFPGKLDLGDPQVERLILGMFSAMAQAADKTAADIERGKYANAREAVQSLMTNMRTAKDLYIKASVPR